MSSPSRRTILKRGLAGGALLALGGAGSLALRRPAPRPVPDGLRSLTPDEYAVFLALIPRFVTLPESQASGRAADQAQAVAGGNRAEPFVRSEGPGPPGPKRDPGGPGAWRSQAPEDDHPPGSKRDPGGPGVWRSQTPEVEVVAIALRGDAILAQTDPGARRDLQQLLGLLENGLVGLLLDGRGRSFTRLPPDEQDAVLRRWRDSRIVLRRTGYQALRLWALAAYYADPESWPGVGYPGPPQGFHQPDAPVWRGGGAPRPVRAGEEEER